MLRINESDGELEVFKNETRIGRIVKIVERYVVKLDDAVILSGGDLRWFSIALDGLNSANSIRFQDLPYTYCFRQEKSGVWIAYVKELKGCMSQGESLEDAFEMVRYAMSGWLLCEIEDGNIIPVPDEDGPIWA
jgi:predicted RNase H-like HicB family nuclease